MSLPEITEDHIKSAKRLWEILKAKDEVMDWDAIQIISAEIAAAREAKP